MSLEELRAQAKAEEQATEEVIEVQAEAEEPEAVIEAEQAEESEESTDFELELEGEPEPSQQKKPSAEEALIHKLTKQRKKTKDAESEVEKLRAEIDQLKQSISKPQPTPQASSAHPVLILPDLYDAGIDGDRAKYNAAVGKAMSEYESAKEAYKNRHAQADQAQEDHKQRVDGWTKTLATRAAKFSTENKVNVDRVATALELATADIDAATGIDGAMAYLLDSVGDGSERVAYYIGTNEIARSKVKELIKQDPNGLKAIAHMTRLAEKLKPKKRQQLSGAPEPDQPLQGDAISSMSASQLQSEWDRTDGKDFDRLRKLRQKARELGVALKN